MYVLVKDHKVDYVSILFFGRIKSNHINLRSICILINTQINKEQIFFYKMNILKTNCLIIKFYFEILVQFHTQQSW